MGVALAGFAPTLLVEPWLMGGAILAIGFGICSFLASFRVSAFGTTTQTNNIARLVMVQLSFLLITGLQFYFFEFQTQASTRFARLGMGTCFHLLQQEPILLGLAPWVLYTVLGIAWASYTRATGKSPLFLANSPWLLKRKYGSFFIGFWYQTYFMASLLPFVFVGSLIFVSLVETGNHLLEWNSLFLQPLKTGFICALLLVVFRKKIKTLASAMIENKWLSVGKTMLLYILFFSFFFLWLHGTSDWFTVKLDPKTEATMSVSAMMGHLSETTIHTRLSYLMFGWWLVWTPWMASWVARVAMQSSFLSAFVQSLIIPVVSFGVLLPSLSVEEWNNKMEWLSLPMGGLVTSLALVGFTKLAWGHFRKIRHIFSGGMQPMAMVVQHSTKQWVEMMLMWFSCYLLSWFVLGWLPMQLILTIGIFFILISLSLSLFGWGAFLRHQLALKKCRDLG